MPDFTGEQVIQLVALFVGPTSVFVAAVVAIWKRLLKPGEQRLSDLEKTQKKLEDAQEKLEGAHGEHKALLVAENERCLKERDEANARLETVLSSHATTSATLKELSGVISDGNKSLTEEIRIIRVYIESSQRNHR